MDSINKSSLNETLIRSNKWSSDKWSLAVIRTHEKQKILEYSLLPGEYVPWTINGTPKSQFVTSWKRNSIRQEKETDNLFYRRQFFHASLRHTPLQLSDSRVIYFLWDPRLRAKIPPQWSLPIALKIPSRRLAIGFIRKDSWKRRFLGSGVQSRKWHGRIKS